MSTETPDRQNMWVWTMLAALGAFLAIAGWWRLAM
jgi:hypothetical protein